MPAAPAAPAPGSVDATRPAGWLESTWPPSATVNPSPSSSARRGLRGLARDIGYGDAAAAHQALGRFGERAAAVLRVDRGERVAHDLVASRATTCVVVAPVAHRRETDPVADPDRGRHGGGRGRDPGVGRTVGGSGLTEDRYAVARVGASTRTARHHALKRIGGGRRDLRIERLGALGRLTAELRAVGADHLLEHDRLAVQPVRGNRRVGVRHAEHGHLVRAEHGRGTGLERLSVSPLDAELRGHVADRRRGRVAWPSR